MNHGHRYAFVCSFILLLMTSHSFADWRGPANVTKGNQHEHGISIKVSVDETSQKYVIVVQQFRDKCCWGFPNGEPPEGFGSVIYRPQDRLDENRLEFDSSGRLTYVLDKDAITSAYLLFDFCGPVLDGGYYYVIDLSTYTE